MGVFGAFHFSRVFFHIFGTKIMSKFGKPALVRETSKIATNNPIAYPFLWSRKFYRTNVMKKTEDNLLKGVILEKKLED